MGQKIAVITMIMALLLALGTLTFVFGSGPEGQFNLVYGLLTAAATLAVSAIIVFAITGFQWWVS